MGLDREDEGGVIRTSSQHRVQSSASNTVLQTTYTSGLPVSALSAHSAVSLSLLSVPEHPPANSRHGVVDAVLDKDSIKIMPRSPVVPEGHTLQVSCVAIQLLNRQEGQAPYMTFEFPPMEERDEKKISMALRPGELGVSTIVVS